MNNIFFVINKEKIYAYIVSIMTIVVIFFMSNLINSDLKNTELTTSNSIEKTTESTNTEKDVNSDNIIKNENSNNVEETIGEAIYTSSPYNTTENSNNGETKNEIENDTLKQSNNILQRSN